MRAPNLGLAVASLLLSVSFWVYIQSQEALRVPQTFDLPLQIYGLNPDYSILRSPEKEVSVIANGTPEQLAKFKELLEDSKAQKKSVARGLVAVLDLSSATPDDLNQVYPVLLPRNELVRQAGIRFVDAPEIPVVVVFQRRRELLVQIEPVDVSEGWAVSAMKIEPSSVWVGGPRFELNQVTTLKGIVALKDHRPGRTYPVTIKAYDKDGAEIKTVKLEDPSVIATPTLSVAPPEKSVIIEVELMSGTRPAPGYRLVSYAAKDAAALVRGSTTVLGKTQSIKTAPINLSNLKSSEKRMVALVAPTGATLAVTKVEIELVVEKIPVISGSNP